MKTTRFYLFTLFSAWAVASGPVFAQEEQDSSKMWRIETIDGKEYYGYILSRDDAVIRLKTAMLGVISIPAGSVRSIEPVGPQLIREGEVWADNPQATRYFVSANAYGLKKGEGYYQNIWVVFNQVSIGISDNASIGIGMLPLFLFGGAPTPVWLTPKFSFPIVPGKFNVGGGALLGGVIAEDGGFFGIPYGIATFGSRDRNLTLGLGYGFAGGEWAPAPTVTLSGITRISRRSYLMTENLIPSIGEDVGGIISFGGRTVWTGISLDYGLIIPVGAGIDSFVAIPLIGLVVPFGKTQGT